MVFYKKYVSIQRGCWHLRNFLPLRLDFSNRGNIAEWANYPFAELLFYIVAKSNVDRHCAAVSMVVTEKAANIHRRIVENASAALWQFFSVPRLFSVLCFARQPPKYEDRWLRGGSRFWIYVLKTIWRARSWHGLFSRWRSKRPLCNPSKKTSIFHRKNA